MIQTSWDDHPSYLKSLLTFQMPTRDSFQPKWVLCSPNTHLDTVFIEKYFAWQSWFSTKDIIVLMCTSTFTIVFGNDADLALFKLTWL